MLSFIDEISKRDLRDAARLAMQSATAAAATHLAMSTLGMPEKFVGILSAVFVVQPSVGSALVKAGNRFGSTLAGCAIGVLAMLALPDGWGTAVALAVSMLIMNGLAGLKPQWRYGVVAAVALAMGSEGDALETAQERTLSIGLGILIGFACSLVIWPERASTRAHRNAQDALSALADFCQSALKDVAGEHDESRSEERSRYEAKINSARESAEAVRIADDDRLWNMIDAVKRVYHATVILDRAATESEDADEETLPSAERLQEVRECSCNIIQCLADGDAQQEDQLDRLRSMIESIREGIGTGSEDGTDATLRHALLFGIGELEDSLSNLVELYQGDGESE